MAKKGKPTAIITIKGVASWKAARCGRSKDEHQHQHRSISNKALVSRYLLGLVFGWEVQEEWHQQRHERYPAWVA